MKPFTDNGHLTPDARTFNYRLSRARIVIENAFGRLKGRWRCLLKRTDMDLKHIPNVIATCVVLHNICEIHKEQFNDEWLTEAHGVNCTSSEQDTTGSSSSTDPSAEDIRRALKAYVVEHPL